MYMILSRLHLRTHVFSRNNASYACAHTLTYTHTLFSLVLYSQTTEDLPEWKKTQSKNLSYGKSSKMSIREQRESLPIFKFKQKLLQAVKENQMLVVIGETGSGKTTQVKPHLLHFHAMTLLVIVRHRCFCKLSGHIYG